MKEKILTEISEFCEECPRKDCCPEIECILYQIETTINSESELEIEE